MSTGEDKIDEISDEDRHYDGEYNYLNRITRETIWDSSGTIAAKKLG